MLRGGCGQRLPPPPSSSLSLSLSVSFIFSFLPKHSSKTAESCYWIIRNEVPNVSMSTHSIFCLINTGGEYRRKGWGVCSSHMLRFWRSPRRSKKLLLWAQKPYLVVWSPEVQIMSNSIANWKCLLDHRGGERWLEERLSWLSLLPKAKTVCQAIMMI